MRALRLLALAAVLLLAYFAQYLFDNGTLAHLYPGWMTQRFPLLVRTTLWLPGDLYTLALWLLAGSALLFGLLVPAWPEPAASRRPPLDESSHLLPVGAARKGWLVVLLAGVALLVGWGWTGLPVRIDPLTARFGLEAQALLSKGGFWLGPGATGAPLVAGLPLGLLTAVLRSGPAASHLLGLLAALATVSATYLLATELFDGAARARQLGLLAGSFAGCALALLHFGRLAPWLPATAAGTAAAWLLLAGERRQKRASLAASGLLVALACYLDRSGLVFVTLLLVWRLGSMVERRRTQPDSGRREGLPFAVWAAWAVFALCTLLALAPLLVAWLLDPPAFGLYLRGGQTQEVVDWWTNLRATAATFFWLPDASPVFGAAGHFVHSLVAPLFVLGLGALVWSLGRPLGWRLLSWFVIGVLFSSTTNALAPYWPTLLPLLPLVGIAVVYTLNRVAVLWEEPSRRSGEDGASASLAVGLLVATVALTAVYYYQFAATNGDGPSYTGRALAALPAGGVAVLVASSPEQAVRLDDPVVQFAAGARANQALALLVDALPPSLPPGSLILVQGSDAAALAAVRAQYPHAAVEVVRDLRGNPRLYVMWVD